MAFCGRAARYSFLRGSASSSEPAPGVPISTRTAAPQHPAGLYRVPGLRVVGAFLATLLIALVAVVLPAGSAQAAPSFPEEGKPLLGAVLEWGEDSAAGFADRLGASLAILGHDIAFPYRSSEQNDIKGFLEQSSLQGAHAMLTVKPTVPLDQIDAAAARRFAERVLELASGTKDSCWSGLPRT